MIGQFEEWTASFAEMASLDVLQGTVVGIEAADYLNRLPKFPVPHIDRPIKEALVPALGPIPFGLRSVFKNTIAVWKSYKIKPVFVFSGLDVGKRDTSFAASEEAARINSQAWSLYYSNDATSSVEAFGKSNAVTAEDLFRFLQVILHEEDIEFFVAPYGAWAQLSYLYNVKAIDAIAGSSEILLFDVPEIITTWDFKQAEFTWVKRGACIKDVGAVSLDVFVDACLLSGNALLPTFPLLETSHNRKMFKVKHANEMIMQSMGRSGHSLCLHYQDEPSVQHSNYLDRFRKARLAVKHHVVLTLEGKVEPFDVDNAPGDIHEFIGQRLPEELYFYLSKGIIGPRILNWRTSGEIVELPPIDNGDSDQYRNLVRNQLNDIRTSAISLLSSSLTRFYQHKDLSLRCWFDKNNAKVISMRDLDSPALLIKDWNVSRKVYDSEQDKYKSSGLLGLAVKSVKNTSFAKNSITKKSSEHPLKTKDEILLNSFWRLLRLRGYINNDHTLSPWGNALNAAMSALPTSENTATTKELEEAVLIAVELARLGLLNATDMHTSYPGGPWRGDEKVKRNTLLVSRIACLAKLNHKEIGYTGPLSRNYLGYHSMTNAVRASLRDLAEVCLATLLLNGDADRQRTDYTELGLELPFVLQNTCALGLAVNSYLDDVATGDTPSTAESKAAAKKRLRQDVFIYVEDYEGDLKKAFQLWDAVYAGVKAAGDLFKERKLFDETDKWLAAVR